MFVPKMFCDSTLRGKNPSQTLWVMTHTDVVPAGDIKLWTTTQPFEPLVKEGKVYGRGSEDNMQSMVASIFAVKALKMAFLLRMLKAWKNFIK